MQKKRSELRWWLFKLPTIYWFMHDIRTPIAVAAGYGKLIQERLDQFSKADLMRLGDQLVGAQGQLAEKVRMFQVITGDLRLAPIAFRAIEAIQPALDWSRTYCRANDVKVHNGVPDDILLFADRCSLSAALYWLLAGFANYSTATKIELRLGPSSKPGYVEVILLRNGRMRRRTPLPSILRELRVYLERNDVAECRVSSTLSRFSLAIQVGDEA